jgi:DnaJ-class molecular chaperone
LYVRVRIAVPKGLNEESRALLDQLADHLQMNPREEETS